MKKYVEPEINISTFDVEDIISTSGLEDVEDGAGWG